VDTNDNLVLANCLCSGLSGQDYIDCFTHFGEDDPCEGMTQQQCVEYLLGLVPDPRPDSGVDGTDNGSTGGHNTGEPPAWVCDPNTDPNCYGPKTWVYTNTNPDSCVSSSTSI
jgi:hypothetical protein